MERLDFVKTLKTAQGDVQIFSLPRLEEQGITQIERLPFSIRVLLENLLRHLDHHVVHEEHLLRIAQWQPKPDHPHEIPFFPARVVLQDFTGVPAVVDLAAMRSAMKRLNGDPAKINPVVPADLVIDHSVQVDYFGTIYAFPWNVKREFERNRERYALLRWAQDAFQNFRVVPPGKGIIHQVNLEYLARVVQTREIEGKPTAFPDTLVGTDSHTTMINGLGVLGWGVGGIEAEAVLLGQPYYMLVPQVVGVRLTGELPEGATTTDLVLRVTQMLREKGVVGKFVEFFGPGVSKLSLPDRATLANMAPEYGATMGFFPVDQETLEYLRRTGRDDSLIDLVERYTKEQGLFRTDEAPDPEFSDVLELDMSTVEPSLAGPKRPQDRIPLRSIKTSFQKTLKEVFHVRPEDSEHCDRWESEGGAATSASSISPAIIRRLHGVPIIIKGEETFLNHGSVVIAAITSCTNTSNPSVMIGAGLLAKKAVERGLEVRPHVKTSLAPGSTVVRDYLQRAGLMPYLEALGFHLVGFGCTTCIGNSGPLPEPVERAIVENDLVVAAVLSGNRNFEARIHPLVKTNYLASPMLVVAYALVGRIDVDFDEEPVGIDPNGQPVFLKDIWPSQDEIREAIAQSLDADLFRERYADVFHGDERWQALEVPSGDLYHWDPKSTYIQEPPFFQNMGIEVPDIQDIRGARVLALLGDTVTTDHISPAGAIPKDSPAGQYLISQGVSPSEFNTYGSRRGNHEVMMRGTFANVRLRNLLVPGTEGGWTIYFPTGEKMPIYDAAMKYHQDDTPLLVIAGKEYGTGSSRDWAAKGTALLGVKAVLAESFERIHRSNLVGMGVLPLQFVPGENAQTLGLDGTEIYDIVGLQKGIQPGMRVTVRAHKSGGDVVEFEAIVRLDSVVEIEYYRNGGILQYVLRKMLRGEL